MCIQEKFAEKWPTSIRLDVTECVDIVAKKCEPQPKSEHNRSVTFLTTDLIDSLGLCLPIKRVFFALVPEAMYKKRLMRLLKRIFKKWKIR